MQTVRHKLRHRRNRPKAYALKRFNETILVLERQLDLIFHIQNRNPIFTGWDSYQSSWITKRLNLERCAVSMVTQKSLCGIKHINSALFIYYTKKIKRI